MKWLSWPFKPLLHIKTPHKLPRSTHGEGQLKKPPNIPTQTTCSPQSQESLQFIRRETQHLPYTFKEHPYLGQYFKISRYLSIFPLLHAKKWMIIFKKMRKSHSEKQGGICSPGSGSAGMCSAWCQRERSWEPRSTTPISDPGTREYSCTEAQEVTHSISRLQDRVLFLRTPQLLLWFWSCIPFIAGVVLKFLGILQYMLKS